MSFSISLLRPQETLQNLDFALQNNMWVDKNLQSVKKDSRIFRFLKNLTNLFNCNPLKRYYSSIKCNNVMNNLLLFCQTHEAILHEYDLETARKVIQRLQLKTLSKYASLSHSILSSLNQISNKKMVEAQRNVFPTAKPVIFTNQEAPRPAAMTDEFMALADSTSDIIKRIAQDLPVMLVDVTSGQNYQTFSATVEERKILISAIYKSRFPQCEVDGHFFVGSSLNSKIILSSLPSQWTKTARGYELDVLSYNDSIFGQIFSEKTVIVVADLQIGDNGQVRVVLEDQKAYINFGGIVEFPNGRKIHMKDVMKEVQPKVFSSRANIHFDHIIPDSMIVKK